MAQYKKAPKFVGKDLSLNLGRGDMKILDNVVYTDSRLERFVGLGFLVRVKDGEKAGPTVGSSIPQSPAPPAPALIPLATVTRSPASRVTSGSKVSTRTPDAPVNPIVSGPELPPGQASDPSFGGEAHEPVPPTAPAAPASPTAPTEPAPSTAATAEGAAAEGAGEAGETSDDEGAEGAGADGSSTDGGAQGRGRRAGARRKADKPAE